MNRRGFIGSLLATALLDPEKLLWVPGKKTIFIPKPPKIVPDEGISMRFIGSFDPLDRRWLSKFDVILLPVLNGRIRRKTTQLIPSFASKYASANRHGYLSDITNR